MLNNLGLYFVTPDDDDLNHIRSLCCLAIQGGVDIIQLRYKKNDIRSFLAQAKEISALCKKHNIPFIINDRIDIALAADADGVHLGQSDMPIIEARKILGEKAIIGLSIEERDQIHHPDVKYADYLAASPVFSTSTKKDIKQPLGLDGLAYIAKATAKPIVAIGGIKIKHIKNLIQNGAQMIAVISAISAAKDPRQATQEFNKEINKWSQNDHIPC